MLPFVLERQFSVAVLSALNAGDLMYFNGSYGLAVTMFASAGAALVAHKLRRRMFVEIEAEGLALA